MGSAHPVHLVTMVASVNRAVLLTVMVNVRLIVGIVISVKMVLLEIHVIAPVHKVVVTMVVNNIQAIARPARWNIMEINVTLTVHQVVDLVVVCECHAIVSHVPMDFMDGYVIKIVLHVLALIVNEMVNARMGVLTDILCGIVLNNVLLTAITANATEDQEPVSPVKRINIMASTV